MHPFRLHAPILSPLSPSDAAWFPEGAIAVDEHGRIAYLGPARDLPSAFAQFPEVRAGGLVIPGLVDCHVHLPQYDCRGKFGTTLLEWLDRFIYPAEARFAEEEIARDTSRRFFAALTRAGTTTAMVYATVHGRATDIAFEEAERSRLRIILGKVLMDRNAPPALLEETSTAIADTERLIEKWHRRTDRLWYAVTPRFAPVCSRSLLRAAGSLAEKHGTYVQTHINESPGEVEQVRVLFPECETYLDVYFSAGLLSDRTMLAHNIHVTDGELAACETARCSVAHCPDSNLFLGSGRFPIERFSSTSIRLGLGSDVGAGTTLFMLGICRAMAYAQGRSLHPFHLLYMATLGGANALSLDDRIGSLDAGKQADMVEVHLDPHFCSGKPLRDVSKLELASALVYRAHENDVRRVWVGGDLLHPA